MILLDKKPDVNGILYRIDGTELRVERVFCGARPAAALIYELLEERLRDREHRTPDAEEAD